jgi:hypothetical protein
MSKQNMFIKVWTSQGFMTFFLVLISLFWPFIERRNLLQIDSTHFHKKLCYQIFKGGKFLTMTSKLKWQWLIGICLGIIVLSFISLMLLDDSSKPESI